MGTLRKKLNGRPKANLSPILLDTGAGHLKVMKFSEAIETYIVMGFRGQVTKSGVWKYISTFSELLLVGKYEVQELSRWKSRGDYSSIERRIFSSLSSSPEKNGASK